MKKSIYLLVICFSFFYYNFIDAQIIATFTTGSSMVHSPKYFGLNGANVWNYPNGYSTPGIDANLSLMKVKHVRHIGGAYSMFFNWQTGFPLTNS